MQDKQITCLVCGETNNITIFETHKEYTIFECADCGLHFSEPRQVIHDNYRRAYGGEDCMGQYARKMSTISDLLDNFDEAMLLSYEKWAVKWLNKNMAKNSVIFDLGCGNGRMLTVLRNRGFRVFGMDIADEPINFLKSKGFEVALGTINDYPKDWPSPDTILMLEVLEHLPEPFETLRDIRSQFERSAIVISVPSPHRWSLKNRAREPQDYPPHHFTRWSKNAISILLDKAGYHPVVVTPLVSPLNITSGLRGIVSSLCCNRRKSEDSESLNDSEKGYTPSSLDIVNQLNISKGLIPTARMVNRIFKYLVNTPKATYLNLAGYRATSMLCVGFPV